MIPTITAEQARREIIPSLLRHRPKIVAYLRLSNPDSQILGLWADIKNKHEMLYTKANFELSWRVIRALRILPKGANKEVFASIMYAWRSIREQRTAAKNASKAIMYTVVDIQILGGRSKRKVTFHKQYSRYPCLTPATATTTRLWPFSREAYDRFAKCVWYKRGRPTFGKRILTEISFGLPVIERRIYRRCPWMQGRIIDRTIGVYVYKTFRIRNDGAKEYISAGLACDISD